MYFTQYILYNIFYTIYFILYIAFNCLGKAGHRFGYSNYEQRKWREEHSSCGGEFQSPIKIDSLKALPLRMPALEMVRYHDLLPGPLELHNNGHSGWLFNNFKNALNLFTYLF